MRITVLTPTFNRAHTLHRCFDSLSQQTFSDFEWVVIDDGSVDGTEALVKAWAAEAAFPIHYQWKENGGKPSAVNAGLEVARGQYIGILDSDDALLPDTLEVMLRAWDEIPAEQRDRYWTVIGLCRNAKTRTVDGDRFPEGTPDATWEDLCFKWKTGGEKWGLMRTDLLRQAIPKESLKYQYAPPSLRWGRVARSRLYRCLNVVVRDYYIPEGPRTGHLSGLENRIRNAEGFLLADIDVLNHDLPTCSRLSPLYFCKRAIQYARFGFHAKNVMGLWRQLRPFEARALVLVYLPVGFLLYSHDLVWLRMTQSGPLVEWLAELAA